MFDRKKLRAALLVAWLHVLRPLARPYGRLAFFTRSLDIPLPPAEERVR